MRHWLLFCALTLLLNYGLLGQSDIKTKLYFRNGTILIGELISLDGDTSVLIRINNTTKGFPTNAIKKIVMIENKKEEVDEKIHLTNPLYYNLQISSITNQVYKGFSLNQSVFYPINNKLLVGVGIGLENYVENNNLNTMPLYSTAKYYFKNKKKTPFVSVKYGYGFIVPKQEALMNGTKGGEHFNATFGLRLWGDYFVTEIFGGIKQQSLTIVENNWGINNTFELTANRLELGISFMF